MSERRPEGELTAAERRFVEVLRRMERGEPSADLDAAILARARQPMRGSRRLPSWFSAAAGVAVLVFGGAVAYRVQDLERREHPVVPVRSAADEGKREQPGVPAPVLDEEVGGVEARRKEASAEPTVPAAPAFDDRESGKVEAASRARAAAPPPVASSEPLGAATRDDLPPATAAGALAPRAAPAPPSQSREQASVPVQMRGAPDTHPAMADAGESAAPARQQEAPTLAKRAAPPGEAGPSAEEWLQQIRDLVAIGQHQAARVSMAAFRERHPEVEIPDDLKPLLDLPGE